MTGNSGLLATVPTKLSPLSPFLVREYILKYKCFLDCTRFASMPIDRQHPCNPGFCAKRATAVGASIERWAHWGGSGVTLLFHSVAVLVDMHFILSSEDLCHLS